MRLQDLLQSYPHFRLATEQDNQKILKFFRDIGMKTSQYSVRYDRGEDFFQFSKEQSRQSFLFLIENEEGEIKGTGSIILINHFYKNEKTTCAYLGDLRISPTTNPRVRIHWKKFYGELVYHFKDLEEFQGTKFLYTAVLDENLEALKSLTKNNPHFQYHPLSSYVAHSILRPQLFKNYFLRNRQLKLKFHSNNSDISSSPVSADHIKSFIRTENSFHTFGHFFSLNPNDQPDELERRLQDWQNFSDENFVCVADHSHKILVAGATKEFQSKKLVISEMRWPIKILTKILPFLGIPKIKSDGVIKVQYLTHLVFHHQLSSEEKTLALNFLLENLLRKKNRDFHILSFFEFPQWNIHPLKFYGIKTPAKFYQVLKISQVDSITSEEIINLSQMAPPFEIGIS